MAIHGLYCEYSSPHQDSERFNLQLENGGHVFFNTFFGALYHIYCSSNNASVEKIGFKKTRRWKFAMVSLIGHLCLVLDHSHPPKKRSNTT